MANMKPDEADRLLSAPAALPHAMSYTSDEDQEAAEAMLTIYRASQSPPVEEPPSVQSGTVEGGSLPVSPNPTSDPSFTGNHSNFAADSFRRKGRPCEGCRAVRKRCEVSADTRSCSRCVERNEACVFVESQYSMPLEKRQKFEEFGNGANHNKDGSILGGTSSEPCEAPALHPSQATVQNSLSPALSAAVLLMVSEKNDNKQPASSLSLPRIAKTRRHAACTSCHSKKTKCDMRKPTCTNCRERNVACLYPLPPVHGSDGEPRKTHFTLPRARLFDLGSSSIESMASASSFPPIPSPLADQNPQSAARVNQSSPDPGYYTSSGPESSPPHKPLDSVISSDPSMIPSPTVPAIQVTAHMYSPAYFERDAAFSSRFTNKKALKQAAATAATLASHPHLSLADLVLDRLPKNKPGAPPRRLKCGKLWILDPETAEKVYFCPLCRKEYGTANGIKYHLGLHPPAEVAQIPGGWYWSREGDAEEEDAKVFRCDVGGCGKAYSTVAGLKYHLAKGTHGPVRRGKAVTRDEDSGMESNDAEDYTQEVKEEHAGRE